MSDRSAPRTLTPELEVTGPLDRRAVEALNLEIRRLLEAHGLEVKRITIREVTGE